MSNVTSGSAAGFLSPGSVAAPGNYNQNDLSAILNEQVRLLTRLSSILAPPQGIIGTDWNNDADKTIKAIDLVNGSFNGFLCNLSAGFVDVWFGGIQQTTHPDLTFGGSTTTYQVNLPLLTQYKQLTLVARGGPVGKLYVTEY